jgi:hypothetical protein
VILACHLASEAEARPLYDEANQQVGIFITSVRRLRAPQTFAKVIVSLLVVFVILIFWS